MQGKQKPLTNRPNTREFEKQFSRYMSTAKVTHQEFKNLVASISHESPLLLKNMVATLENLPLPNDQETQTKEKISRVTNEIIELAYQKEQEILQEFRKLQNEISNKVLNHQADQKARDEVGQKFKALNEKLVDLQIKADAGIIPSVQWLHTQLHSVLKPLQTISLSQQQTTLFGKTKIGKLLPKTKSNVAEGIDEVFKTMGMGHKK